VKKLHEQEVDIDDDLVRELVGGQFPDWCDLPIEAVPSTGTVNAIFRLGVDLCVRMPRVERWAADLEKELEWLPKIAPRLSLAVPEPVAQGVPGSGYPFAWAVYRWLEGEPFAADRIDDERRTAADLARFVTELRGIDLAGAPRCHRDQPIRALDAQVRAVITSLHGVIDTEATTAAWEGSMQAPEWRGSRVSTHGDLLPPNLLVEQGRLRSVIDFGSIGVADPAVDVIAAWSVFGPDGRHAFRVALDVDDGTWVRARGLALHQALQIIPYYRETNPAFVDVAKRTVAAVLDDHASRPD
jgi:aminoglycoside phosphotransferase (APT) family kinase protein